MHTKSRSKAIAIPCFEDYFNSNEVSMPDSGYDMDEKEEEVTNMSMNFE